MNEKHEGWEWAQKEAELARLQAEVKRLKTEAKETSDMHQETLQHWLEESDDFRKALGLPEFVAGSESEVPGYQHILDAIVGLKRERDEFKAQVAALFFGAKGYVAPNHQAAFEDWFKRNCSTQAHTLLTRLERAERVAEALEEVLEVHRLQIVSPYLWRARAQTAWKDADHALTAWQEIKNV